MKILSIDPSVNNVGFVVIDLASKTVQARWQWGMIHPKGNNLQAKLADIVTNLNHLVKMDEITHLITEWPTFFGSVAGAIAAEKGYTINLAAVNSYVAGSFGFRGSKWVMITATEWKGSVTKAVTMRKFLRFFNPKIDFRQAICEHEVDALMMAHWWIRTQWNDQTSLVRKRFPQLPPEFSLSPTS